MISGSQRRSTWWGPSELQWQNYRIEGMPSRTKPLLVFVNTKCGPMLGHTLRRKFLRLLNPLQVRVPLTCTAGLTVLCPESSAIVLLQLVQSSQSVARAASEAATAVHV